MLQNSKAQTLTEEFESVSPQQEGLAELVDWTFGLLRRQYLVILFVTALGLGAGALYLFIAQPTYAAATNVYIDLHRNPLDQRIGVFGNDPIEIESQIQIIRSSNIALSVIKKLQLMNDPEFVSGGRSIFQILQFWNRPSAKPESNLDPMEKLIGAFEANLKIEPAGGRVIAIEYSSKSPERAAQIANAIANAYITDQLEAKYDANRVATGWLEQRQQQLLEQADVAQRASDAFKKQNNLVTSDGKLLDNVEVNELNNRLIAARAQATDLSARISRLQTTTKLGASNPQLEGAISDINSPIVTGLRQQYLELARRENEWSVRFGKDHLAVVNIRNRMQELRSSLFEEVQRAADAAKNDYELVKQRQSEIEKQLANSVAQMRSTSQVQSTLTGLEGTANAYRKLYDSFLQQYMGATQQATFPITEARVISAASPMQHKIKPKPILVLALSLFGGLALGGGLGLLRDAMDRVFRTAKQLEAELHVPCVALVPLVKTGDTRQTWQQSISGHKVKAPNNFSADPRVFKTVIETPLSSFAEAIRSIKLSIDLHMDTQPCKVIGITSTVPNEGKSTVAAALAHVIAQVGGHVLLVDCDLRNPTLSRLLHKNATAGLFDIIAKKISIPEAITKQEKSSLAFLSAGKRIPLFLTSEIIGGASIASTFDVLRQHYRYIIVDLPPLTPIVDVRASTHFVDAYLLTVEWGRTKIDAVQQSLKAAPKIYDGLIGSILNKADMDAIARYDNSGRYSRNNQYSRYGYID